MMSFVVTGSNSPSGCFSPKDFRFFIVCVAWSNNKRVIAWHYYARSVMLDLRLYARDINGEKTIAGLCRKEYRVVADEVQMLNGAGDY
ncbi:MAG: hypothetical protein NVV73_10055 [Cellvibrionaceae bacterium]|nr:hypothetical protein [Cellvibrionaceae bacterium]